MIKSWYTMMMLAAESQQVIWLRSMKLAAGGAAAGHEVRLMIAEKIQAATAESGKLMTGASHDSVVKRYRSKVRANRRRLLK